MKKLLLAVLALATIVTSAQANEILGHCQSTSGKYGNVMVKHCVDAENAAVAELDDWRNLVGQDNNQAMKIADHCMSTSYKYGWVMVNHCIQAEVTAYEELYGSLTPEAKDTTMDDILSLLK